MNLQIENTKTEIINVINNSGLPIGIIHYLFRDIADEVASEYRKVLIQEREQLKLQQEKEREKTETKEDKQESDK